MAQTLPIAVRVRAPGKINVALSVGPLREDGYHDLATVFLAVSLYEEVAAWPARGFTVTYGGSVDTSMLTGDDTLVHRAARLVAAELSAEQRAVWGIGEGGVPGVHIAVEKHVPIAGGMGGGSADAAATLLACNALWNVGLGKERLWELAATLGADVPFALQGGTALGLGRGDELTPVLAGGTFHWVLVPNETGLSTPAVYRELDRLRAEHVVPNPDRAAVAPEVMTALRSGSASGLRDALHNDLQAAAFSLAPELETRVRQFNLHRDAMVTLVSGSGPTLAILAPDQIAARMLVADLRAQGLGAIEVVGPVHGAHFVHEPDEDDLLA
ncbi:MAG TPA: 4-(cytidine 5'-diphospho)-2-C-methyl-D-erythritol kinase [Microbacteriaceae bacterium]|nr:4-(cytidine 5'-diphospho)-2-C-methyl-D-erythritol kinase [Microbacteriaceae bacterium]